MNKFSQNFILSTFAKLYPDPHSELNFRNSYELLVAVMLSAQCTDKKVNEVTPSLFERFPDFEKLARARLTDVEKIIRPVNYYRTKARNLLSMAETVSSELDGKLPRTREGLMALPGVGQKTASVILSELRIEPALPVDTHVFRVARRLGLSSGKDPREVEEDLKRSFPSKTWRELHHWLIFHGRRVCKARGPACSSCPLSQRCPSSSER